MIKTDILSCNLLNSFSQYVNLINRRCGYKILGFYDLYYVVFMNHYILCPCIIFYFISSDQIRSKVFSYKKWYLTFILPDSWHTNDDRTTKFENYFVDFYTSENALILPCGQKKVRVFNVQQTHVKRSIKNEIAFLIHLIQKSYTFFNI